MRQFIFIITALTCALPLFARPQSGYYANPDVDELRIELDDLKHALKSTQVELGLLDERLKKNTASAKNDSKDASSISLLSAQVSSLEKKVANLEKTLDKTSNDLRTLNSSLSQTLTKVQNAELALSGHDKRLEEVSKLKGTLTNISKAIGQRPAAESPSAATKSYRVKAGDSLEKIARIHHTTADTIRKTNNLTNDKIIVGQELRLPDEAG
jgi:LysM repeat protein